LAVGKTAKSAPKTKPHLATFAAGCFWGVEERFRCLPGVIATKAGYTGGKSENPTYEQVCTNLTGHAEAVKIKFDPKKIPYNELLGVFWGSHNPTTKNRQGFDIGTQYRSAIFFHSKEQEKIARQSLAALEASGKWRNIVTEIVPAARFWPAEEYHQKYLMKKGKASCHL